MQGACVDIRGQFCEVSSFHVFLGRVSFVLCWVFQAVRPIDMQVIFLPLPTILLVSARGHMFIIASGFFVLNSTVVPSILLRLSSL